MKLFKLYILSLIISITLSACSKTDEPEPKTEPAERTVLVYMAANNSLGSLGYDMLDLGEMQQAAISGDLGKSRLIIYHHARSKAPELKEMKTDGTIVSLKTYDTFDSSVSSKRMRDVIADMKQIAPSENYGLILWSHGSGWLENGIEPARPYQPQSFGEDAGKRMNVSTLASVLSDRTFDYIYFDCCFMAGIEVMYELRDCTPAIVASATELPANGMPYDQNLRYLMPADANLQAAAQSTFEHYDNLWGSDRTCTISVIDTAHIMELASQTRALFTVADGVPVGFIPQRYMTGTCYLYDFRQYVEALARKIDYDLTEWREAFDRVVTYHAQTPWLWDKISLDNHSGLSTFILEKDSDTEYRGYNCLQWYADVASLITFN